MCTRVHETPRHGQLDKSYGSWTSSLLHVVHASGLSLAASRFQCTNSMDYTYEISKRNVASY